SLSQVICFTFPNFAKYLQLEVFNKQAIEYFDRLTFQILEKRMQSSETGKQNPDLIGLMIESSKNAEDGNTNGTPNGKWSKFSGITKEEISGQGVLFFIAGFDTTHATFDHVIYYLSKYPEWQEKLHQELVENQDSLD